MAQVSSIDFIPLTNNALESKKFHAYFSGKLVEGKVDDIGFLEEYKFKVGWGLTGMIFI